MKTLTILLFFTISISYAQKAEYENLTKKAEYEIYQTKNGFKIKVGDTLKLGVPTSDLGFTYISQNVQRVSNTLAGKNIIIDKLKTYGNKRNGFKMYAHFKGYGLLPVLIDYETALELGEIKNPDGKLTRNEAISKLKEAKDLLDLEMLSKEEFENLKKELAPIIKSGM